MGLLGLPQKWPVCLPLTTCLIHLPPPPHPYPRLLQLPFLALRPRQDSDVISFLLTAEVAEACIVPVSRQLLYRSPPALRTELDPRHSG